MSLRSVLLLIFLACFAFSPIAAQAADATEGASLVVASSDDGEKKSKRERLKEAAHKVKDKLSGAKEKLKEKKARIKNRLKKWKKKARSAAQRKAHKHVVSKVKHGISKALNLANRDEHSHHMDQIKESGLTEKVAPRLFRMIRTAKMRHEAFGGPPPPVRHPSDNPLGYLEDVHFISALEMVDPEEGLWQATAFQSIHKGAPMSHITLQLFDANGDPIGPAEEVTQHENCGIEQSVTAFGRIDPNAKSQEVTAVAHFVYEDKNGNPVSAVAREVNSGVIRGKMGKADPASGDERVAANVKAVTTVDEPLAGLSGEEGSDLSLYHDDELTPGDLLLYGMGGAVEDPPPVRNCTRNERDPLNHTATLDKLYNCAPIDRRRKGLKRDGKIKVCMNRSEQKCDYRATQRGAARTIQFPIRGAIQYKYPVIMDQDTGLPKNGFAVLNISNQTDGGGCTMRTNLDGGSAFLAFAMTPDNKRLYWDVWSSNTEFYFINADGKKVYRPCIKSGSQTYFTWRIGVKVNIEGVETRSTANFSNFTSTLPATVWPPTYEIDPMWVYWGCLEEGTKVTMADGRQLTVESEAINENSVKSAGAHSSMTVDGNTTGIEQKPLYVITADNGLSVAATENHPIWANGKMVAAKDVKVGDSLSTTKGASKVKSISRRVTEKKVWNLNLVTDDGQRVSDPADLSFFAGGILVGDGQVQGMLEKQAAGICDPHGVSNDVKEARAAYQKWKAAQAK